MMMIFTIDVVLAFCLSASLLYRYGDWFRQRIAVTVSVLIAWYFSFLIVFVIPLDVSSTKHRQLSCHINNRTNCTSNFEENVLPNLWRVVYWSSQFLTWLILPLMQSFTQAGEFSVSGKLRSALWDNAVYYASYLFIATILLIYIAFKPELHLDWDRTKAIAAAASNTWGLFVLVLMLGYGLIEVPRNLWRRSQKGYTLTRCYFKLAKLMSEKTEAEDVLDDVLVSLVVLDSEIEIGSPLRPFIEAILARVPVEMLERIQRRRRNPPQLLTDLNENTLTRMNRQVIRALQTQHRTEAQWNDLTNEIFELEDVNRNMISNEHVFKHTLSRSPQGSNLIIRTICNPTAEWYWKCLLMPLLLKGFAFSAAFMSVLIIWSEVTFFSSTVTLSMFAILVDLAGDNYQWIEIICFVTILYLCLCTYYTVFKIRVLNYYYLAKNHQSDEYTLLFSGALLCRLTPPLCLNFLSMIHMDSHVYAGVQEETAYTKIMGHMDVIAIISDYFNVYFPIALLALSMCTYFSVGSRILSSMGFQQFLNHDSDLTIELVEEGKEHIKREKRRRQRILESAQRRRHIPSSTSSTSLRDASIAAAAASSSGIVNESSRNYENIVKSRNNPNLSSPERSLLDHPAGLEEESIDLSSPTRSSIPPPRNIFDDL